MSLASELFADFQDDSAAIDAAVAGGASINNLHHGMYTHGASATGTGADDYGADDYGADDQNVAGSSSAASSSLLGRSSGTAGDGSSYSLAGASGTVAGTSALTGSLKTGTVQQSAPLYYSPDFQAVVAAVRQAAAAPLSDIGSASSLSSSSSASSGGAAQEVNIESNPEYQLVVRGNALIVEIDTEIRVIHKLVRDAYAVRFPELETLVVNPVDYMRTVLVLKNNVASAKDANLASFLAAATAMVVVMGSSTQSGQPLSELELSRVVEASEVAVALDVAKRDIISFVEGRMTFIAPNLSVLLGTSVAAKLLALAGGLTALSKIPACNLQILGQKKLDIATGVSEAPTAPHAGVIYQSDIVQRTQPEFRKHTMRVLAAKVALVARVDAFHQSTDASIGRKIMDEIEAKVEKREEPPPPRLPKPLPAPKEGRKNKRGGARVRKAKERVAPTELRKQANRVSFGVAAEHQNQMDLGYDLGIAGNASNGKIRVAMVDNKSRITLSKKLQKEVQRERLLAGNMTALAHGAGVGQASAAASAAPAVSGTATVAFTSGKGIEIVNPNAAERRAPDSASGYFSTMASFSKVKRPGVGTSAMQM
ncbi:hypothetical protein CAOG_08034 [Capsaspora owczarzaki ATCC 30864]|uniref:Nop domain-containing protein n=1 Tax=Capsaspora owczarzaki (strain ATCC 30864) TaxID=595528 RepID=A0A0D2WXL2_CAPO3|nr:hypothetical protein CAOG_08034 [Capsaspora owczarzaki ATCC 30864]KJE97970.1 hypothetical protein CAOG_008034 [Capsaspora owczarzaki ATCC 30864]|eukprot:XP_004342635.1 hypothetical protein CAOG_08034 [Capsaspora owczarzaki ATCC 30864]